MKYPLPRAWNDFDLRKIASKIKLTTCIDNDGVSIFWKLLLRRSPPLLESVDLILGATIDISIPSNTCKAASTFPFWYSYLPNNALASCKLWTQTIVRVHANLFRSSIGLKITLPKLIDQEVSKRKSGKAMT